MIGTSSNNRAAQAAVALCSPLRGRSAPSDLAVRTARVRILYQSSFPALANLAVASLLGSVAWGHVPTAVLAAWLLAVAGVTAVRVALWKVFSAIPGTQIDAARWERRMVMATSAAGALWALGGAAVAVGRMPLHVEGLVAISVGGMIAGAMFSLTASDAAFRSYVVPAALGPVLGFLAVGDREHIAIAGMGVVYLLVVLLWGRDTARGIESGIRLRLENEALVADLAAVRAAADDADRLKRESFANLGHELRTPLNAIIGFAQSLDAEIWGPLGSARYREYARAIADSGQHLYVLIQNILDLSRHDAGVLELDERAVDLGHEIAACHDMLAASAVANGISLAIEIPEPRPWVIGDATKLRQIVINLAANAVRFTPAGGRVTVAVLRLDDGATEIRVTDTGVGLEPEDIPRALEPFVQVSRDHTRESGGAGLGLPLSKRLAELHDGRLEIDSRPGDGTVVRVTLPAWRATSPPAGHAP